MTTYLRFPNTHARDRAVTILAAGKEDRLQCARLLQARFAVFQSKPPHATGVFVGLTEVLDQIEQERAKYPPAARREVPNAAYRRNQRRNNQRRAGR